MDGGPDPADNAGILSGEDAMKGFKAVGELVEVLGSLEKAGSGSLEKAVETIVQAVKKGRKVLAFGNGGSAAEAQHFAADRQPVMMSARPSRHRLTTGTSAAACRSDRSFSRRSGVRY
jgi:D-sedoheptulose 7-phosphate isomerase